MIEKLAELESDINKAQLESDVLQRQLKDLLPVRQKIEDECLEKYECSIDELPKHKEKLEVQLQQMVDTLEKEISKVREADSKE